MTDDRFLDGKRVLFLAFEYYDYHIHIRNALEKAGASVDTFSVWKYCNIFEKIVFTLLRHLSTKLFFAYNKAYSRSILESIADRKYDDVLVIAGFELPSEFYVELRRRNPEAIFLNYNWDSVKKTMFGNTYLDNVPYFDKVYSFDRKDCENYENLHYLPLFYIQEYKNMRNDTSGMSQDIDLLFIGSLCQYQRYRYVKEIERLCLAQGIRFFHYVRVSKRFFLQNLLRGHWLSGVHFRSLSRNEIIDYYRRSKAIIDLPHHFQSGLTMRVIETLGAGKKLVTYNNSITQEPFYDTKNVLLIDAENLTLDVEFIKQPMCYWNPKIEECSISNWLRRIFGWAPILS